MKFSAAVVLAAAAGASAWKSNVTYTTEVVTAYTTYCPAATEITQGGKTYTVTEATTLTLDCPCTITKPVTTSSSVICHTCTSYQNSTSAVVIPPATTTPVGTGSVPTTKAPAPTSTLATAGAGKAAALSGAGLAGVLGLAAFVL